MTSPRDVSLIAGRCLFDFAQGRFRLDSRGGCRYVSIASALYNLGL
jgi:hypothetical protein